MKNKLALIIISLFFSFQIFGQNANDLEIPIRFLDIEIVGDMLFAISDSFELKVWDLSIANYPQKNHKHIYSKFSAVAKDRNGIIYLGTEEGQIFRLQGIETELEQVFDLNFPIKELCINSIGEIFVLTPWNVFDPQNGKSWDEFDNHASGIIKETISPSGKTRVITKYYSLPQFAYLDSRDRWWMGKSYGEFGGEIQLFDTRNRKIIDNHFPGIENGLFFPKSIFEDSEGNIYITSGIQHLGIRSGEIFKITKDRKVEIVYEGEKSNKRADLESIYRDGVFVGPGRFNQKTNSILFASDKGIREIVIQDTGKIEKSIILFEPRLMWSNEALAIGASMAIKRLEFTNDGKLIFLTSNDGIGVFSDDKWKMLK